MKKHSELATRTLTGIIYAGIVISAILSGRILSALLFWVVGVLGLKEFYGNIKRKGILSPLFWYGCLLGSITYVTLGNILPKDYGSAGVLLAVLLSGLLFILELYRKQKQPFLNIAVTFLGIIYLFVSLVLTYRVAFPRGDYSATFLLSIFVFVWSNDTFAYLSGSLLGKHKLFPRISPGKSLEGFIGGVVLTLGIAGIYAYLSSQNLLGCDILKPMQWFIVAAVVCFAGTYGDLVESLYKRSLHIKDSGNILPGHGGILDRFDSILFAGPAVYIVLQIFSLF